MNQTQNSNQPTYNEQFDHIGRNKSPLNNPHRKGLESITEVDRDPSEQNHIDQIGIQPFGSIRYNSVEKVIEGKLVRVTTNISGSEYRIKIWRGRQEKVFGRKQYLDENQVVQYIIE